MLKILEAVGIILRGYSQGGVQGRSHWPYLNKQQGGWQKKLANNLIGKVSHLSRFFEAFRNFIGNRKNCKQRM
ncbi:hypothetical protein [Xenorhabdus bovienii]|uniref:hypothetical protein n=1 Tax=Xenorhabdus bovienii TaxID=40576 RepID=UPI003DA4C613